MLGSNPARGSFFCDTFYASLNVPLATAHCGRLHGATAAETGKSVWSVVCVCLRKCRSGAAVVRVSSSSRTDVVQEIQRSLEFCLV